MGSIAQTLASLLGESRVTDWDEVAEPLKLATAGAIADANHPHCIAYPETPEQLAAVVACACQNQWRVLPCGHGSKIGWGGLIRGAEVVVSTARLGQVVEHAVGDLTVTVEAGVSFADLQTQLRATGQFLAIDPAYPQQATLGGIVATRDTGALRQRYGGIRDMLIGVSFVRHDGQLAKAGGRVVKNVAGYDLMKLMTGSFGTLGILTQLTFRTYPQSEASKTVVLLGEAEAIRAVTAAVLRSSLTPVAMDVVTPGLLLNINGNQSDQYGLALQFQSITAGVAEQVERLQAIAAPYPLSSQVLADEADPQFWQSLNAALFPPEPDTAEAIAKLGILPAQGVALLTDLQSILAAETWQMRFHAGSGIGTLRLSTERNSPEQLRQVRSYCQRASGYLTLLEAPADWKTVLDPWALEAAVKSLMTRLQDQFDPDRRLSPGRLGQ